MGEGDERMTCERCGGLVLLTRVFGAESELECIICGRSLTGTRAPLPDEALRVRGAHAHVGPRTPTGPSQHYGDELGDDRRCDVETSAGRCRNPGKVGRRCWLHRGGA